MASALLTWLPDAETAWRDLTFRQTAADIAGELGARHWQGMRFEWKARDWDLHWFDAAFWPSWTSHNWQIPLLAVAVYLAAIPALRGLVQRRGRYDVRTFAFYWNASLSAFSWCGVFACVPVLVGSLLDHGFLFTCCAPSTWYGTGLSGFFVALFIYSKVAELLDTVLLLLAGKQVIALQWWHHSTVLLYCWHSYSTRIATGLWFASMNYSVHAVMYGYFAAMSTRFRGQITRYAILITLAQLLQMVVGMFVTARAVFYQSTGQECHVNRTNSVLGLLMYLSYFVLFLKLFIDNYVTQRRPRSGAGLPAQRSAAALPGKRKTLAEVTHEISRRVTSRVLPQLDLDEDECGDQDLDEDGCGDQDASGRAEARHPGEKKEN